MDDALDRKLKNHEVSTLLNALHALDYEEVDGKRKRTAYKFLDNGFEWSVTKNIVMLTTAANVYEYQRQKLLADFIPTEPELKPESEEQPESILNSDPVLQANTVGQLKFNKAHSDLLQQDSELKLGDLARLPKASFRFDFNKIPYGVRASLMPLIDEQ
jgi:hypothetical protein